MPITLNCPKCKKPFRVRDESVGRKVRCPACAAALQVPVIASPPAMAAAAGRRAPGSRAGALSASAANAPTARAEPVRRPEEEPIADPGQPGSYADLGLDTPHNDDPFIAGDASPSRSGPATAATQPVSTRPPAGGSRTAVARQPAERGAVTGPLRPVGQRGAARSRVRPGLAVPTADEVADLSDGLKQVNVAIFFLLLPFVAIALKAVYLMMAPVTNEQEPGILGVQGLKFWDEVKLAYTALPLLGFFIMALSGRVKCRNAPEVTQSRGMATAALVFTALGLCCLLIYVFSTVSGTDPHGQPTRLTQSSYLAGGVSLILAEVWFCMFLAQIGWPMAWPHMSREVAWFISVAILVPLALFIIDKYYPLFSMDDIEALRRDVGRKLSISQFEARKVERQLVGSVALLVGSLLIVFRYGALAGVARKMVDRFKQMQGG